MKRLLLPTLIASLVLCVPVAVTAQEFESKERAVAAIEARTAAYEAGDYKTACAHSHEVILQTGIFMGEFKAIIDQAEANEGVDRELVARAKATYADVEALQEDNRAIDKDICGKAGLAAAE